MKIVSLRQEKWHILARLIVLLLIVETSTSLIICSYGSLLPNRYLAVRCWASGDLGKNGREEQFIHPDVRSCFTGCLSADAEEHTYLCCLYASLYIRRGGEILTERPEVHDIFPSVILEGRLPNRARE